MRLVGSTATSEGQVIRGWHLWLLSGIVATLSGCTTVRPPDLGHLYGTAAQHRGPERNPVIVIPGTLGSKLVHTPTQRVVWGAFTGEAVNPGRPSGARLLALPMDGRSGGAGGEQVAAVEVLDRLRINVLFVPIELRPYMYLLAMLGVGAYQDQTLGEAGAIDYGDDHYTCFQFPWDWRRDTVDTARALEAFIEEKRAFVERQNLERFGTTGAPVKFDVVAHSAGGVLLRYYLRYGTGDIGPNGEPPPVTWAGAENVERAVLVAPPNAGSLQALFALVRGQKLAPLLPKYDAAILGTMPGLYQLLPRSRHHVLLDPDGHPLDVLDPWLWRRMGWGLASDDADRVLRWLLPDVSMADERRRIAMAHLRSNLRRAEAIHRALDVPASPPDGLELHLAAADGKPTPATVIADRGRLRVVRTAPGDGVVLRSSALMDERISGEWRSQLVSPIGWRSVRFVTTGHERITREPTFMNNLLFLLLEAPRDAAASHRDTEPRQPERLNHRDTEAPGRPQH